MGHTELDGIRHCGFVSHSCIPNGPGEDKQFGKTQPQSHRAEVQALRPGPN